VTSYPDGSTLQSSYTPDGQVATQTDQDDQVTSYSYDADGHMLSETGPLDRTTSYTYDAAGNKASMTDAEGRRTSYSYNSVNELTAVSYTDGSTPDASYSYNPTGQVTMMSDGTGTSTYSYDQLGRLTGTTDGAGASVAYGYDPDGNDTSITYPNGQTVQRKFSDIGNLASVTDWLGNTTSFSYYPNRNLMQTSYPGSTDQTDSYSYNAADEQTAMSTTANSQTVASLGDTYDPDGNVLQESSTGLGDATQTYSYNNLDELTGDNSAPDAYDPDRNLTELDGQSTPMTYDAADELTSGPAGSYSHNRLGERTSQTNGATTTSYGWNQADNLTSVNGGANNLGEGYAYDANGLLQSSTSNGTTTQLTWDTNASIPLLIVDGHTNIIYGPGNLPLEQISSDNQPVYYHHDQLGSTRLLTNTNGDPLETINYSPYGTPTITSGSATTNLLFAGQYTDPNNGMVYLRARWYDPATGQFLSIDPDDSQTDAAYYYAGDNPVTESDPSGDATAAQNEQIAYDYFNGRGDLNAAAAAGIVGNLMVEDGPTACNPQGLGDPNASYCGPCSPRKCGYGIASWTGVRYDALFRVEHSSKPTLLQQLNFIWWEFTTPGASGNGAYFWLTVRSLFPSTNSVAGARADAYLFGYYYEGYSAPSTDRRLGYAAMIWRDRG
jgi:RHS repeat-associated protein